MAALLDALDLRGVDALLPGLGRPASACASSPSTRERFARVVAANTFLPTGDQHAGEAFRAWQQFSQETPEFPSARSSPADAHAPLAPEVIAAYDAPFPDESLQGGRAPVPAARADVARRSRGARPTAPRGRC